LALVPVILAVRPELTLDPQEVVPPPEIDCHHEIDMFLIEASKPLATHTPGEHVMTHLLGFSVGVGVGVGRGVAVGRGVGDAAQALPGPSSINAKIATKTRKKMVGLDAMNMPHIVALTSVYFDCE
jgi:hypothetical protein